MAVRTPVQQLPIEVDSDSANDDDEGDQDEEDEYKGQEATRIGEFVISLNHPHASNYLSRQDVTNHHRVADNSAQLPANYIIGWLTTLLNSHPTTSYLSSILSSLLVICFTCSNYDLEAQ